MGFVPVCLGVYARSRSGLPPTLKIMHMLCRSYVSGDGMDGYSKLTLGIIIGHQTRYNNHLPLTGQVIITIPPDRSAKVEA